MMKAQKFLKSNNSFIKRFIFSLSLITYIQKLNIKLIGKADMILLTQFSKCLLRFFLLIWLLGLVDDLLSSASNKQHYTNDFEGGKHAVKGNGFISTIKRNDVENSPEEYDRIIKNTEASKGQGTSLVQSNVIRITSRYPANINNNVKTESPTNLKTIQGELIETGGGASSYGFFKRKEEDSDTQGIYTLDQTTLIENLENITEDLTTQR